MPWYTVYFERETCRCASNQYRILLFFMPDNIAPLYYSKNQNRQKCFCSFILRHLKSVLSYYYKRWARPNHIEMGRNQATSSTTNQSQIKETTTTTRNWNNFDNFDLYLFIVQLKLLFHWNYERARCALALRSRYAHTHTHSLTERLLQIVVVGCVYCVSSEATIYRNMSFYSLSAADNEIGFRFMLLFNHIRMGCLLYSIFLFIAVDNNKNHIQSIGRFNTAER